MPVFELDDYLQGTILVRPTEFEKAFLYLVINESSNKELIELTHLPTKTKVKLTLNAGQTELFFVDKVTGQPIGFKIGN